MRVSVIIPTYNYGRFLAECIESVLNQTVLPDEIVIVDDGSTDNTPEIIKPYLSNSIVKYIRTENSGSSNARNTAIAASTGDIIGFIDADDIWHEDKLKLQLPLFSNSKVAVVYSGVEWFCDSGVVRTIRVRRLQCNEILWTLLQNNVITTSSVLVRRECFSKIGMFHPDFRLSQDYHLWLRIAAAGFEFDCVDEPLTRYRTGHESATSRDAERFAIIPLIFKDVTEHPQFASAFTSGMLRTALSANFAERAYWEYENGNRWKALTDSIRSIYCRPAGVLDGMAWRILTKSLLPKRAVTMLRRHRYDD